QGVADEAGEQKSDQENEQDAQGQKDQLLDNQPSAVALLRLEQELHRRPLDAAVAQAVNQMDDDRRADQRGAGDHRVGVEKQTEHLLILVPTLRVETHASTLCVAKL